MRAEGQANIDRIEAALALVRQSLDWERALRRLDELNARVQDPKLWENPKEAQAVGREQKKSNIYKALIVRLEQSLEAAFVDEPFFQFPQHGSRHRRVFDTLEPPEPASLVSKLLSFEAVDGAEHTAHQFAVAACQEQFHFGHSERRIFVGREEIEFVPDELRDVVGVVPV